MGLIYLLRCFCVAVQFSQLVQLRQRIGKESFPLIDQTYFPSHREMVSARSPICTRMDAVSR